MCICVWLVIVYMCVCLVKRGAIFSFLLVLKMMEKIMRKLNYKVML